MKQKLRKFDGVEGYDYIVCEICGTQLRELSSHYKRYHPNECVPAVTKCKQLCDNLKGENNPAYQHGGKFSPYSTKFIHYEDESTRKAALKKQGETRKANGTNLFTQEYHDKHGTSLSEYQTRDLDYFTNKYGEIEGKKKHAAKTAKWIKSLDSKTDEEKKRINRMKVGRSGAISKAEKELKQIFLDMGFSVEDQYQIKKNGKGMWMYDLKLNNKIIEYNGDFWHCNPMIYEETFYNPRVKATAKQIWEKDSIKAKTAIENGFDVLVIWEQDYKKDKQGTIDKCIRFLTQ